MSAAIILAAVAALIASGAAPETPQVYLHCLGGGGAHTIILYSSKAMVDGFPYSLGTNDATYAMTGPNIVASFLPNVSAIILVEIDRLTGDYKISAGPDNPAQEESGHCVKVRPKL